MMKPPDIASMSSEDKDNLLLELFFQNIELKAIIVELRAEIDRLKRGSKTSAAPFSKNTPKKDPKRPGRKPGEGNFSRRTAPDPETYSQPIIDVPVAETACPTCGEAFTETRSEIVTVTDIPEVIAPEVLAYKIAICQCQHCGTSVRGEHPAVAADQTGATAHRLGNRLLSTAQWLHYGLGMTTRKIPRIMKDLFGIELTQSALTQHALRQLTGPLAAAYEEIHDIVGQSERVHTDDTGWRINGTVAYLMGFDTDTVAYYQIRPRHRNQEVREVIRSEYAGVMSCDRGTSYDARELLGVDQQKCLSHLLRSVSMVVEQKRGKSLWFGQQLQALLREALSLWHGYHLKKRRPPGWDERVQAVRATMDKHLRSRSLTDRDNQRLLNEFGWHNDRGNLLRFLDDPRIEPTNNRAERMLRPAVIARKVSQCSKTKGGAMAHAMFMSVIETLRKRCGTDVLNALTAILAGGSLPPSTLPATT
jgi:transposase